MTDTERKNKWNKAHYSPLNLMLDKELCERYKRKCEYLKIGYSDIPKAAIKAFLQNRFEGD